MTEMTILEEIDRIIPRQLPQSGNAMPASIVKAICQVQLSLDQAVAKKGRNDFAKFDFATIDDVYAVLSQRMAAAGLVMMTLEEGTAEERVGSSGKSALFVTFRFKFVLASAAGDTWTDPAFVRTLRVQVTGPQSYAAAQSFVDKAVLRSIFKLPTGDNVELDLAKQSNLIENQVDDPATPMKKRKSSAAAKRDGDDKAFNNLKQEIETCRDGGELEAVYQEHYKNDMTFGDFPNGWAHMLNEEYIFRARDLKEAGS